MSRKATPINLAKEEKATLKKWLRASKTERRIVPRAQIILLADQGKPGKDIAASMKVREATVCKWRTRFAKERLGGLQDAPRSGVQRRYGDDTVLQILKKLDETAPEGYADPCQLAQSGGGLVQHIEQARIAWSGFWFGRRAS